MNHAISTLNNLSADMKAQLEAQGARLEALGDSVGAVASTLGSLAAWSAAAFAIQLALLLFAPHAAQALLSFVRRRESPVMRFLGSVFGIADFHRLHVGGVGDTEDLSWLLPKGWW
jgi:hypothetical protein